MTAFLLLLASAMCWAQRGGGTRGGGFASHGGMRPGGGFHAGGAVRGPNHFSGSFRGGQRSGSHPGNGFHHPSRGLRFHDHRFDGRFRAGFYSRYPYYYGSYAGPLWWDYADSSYDAQPDNSYAQYQTNSELSRLSDEVQELREQEEARQYQPAPAASQPQAKTEAKPPEDLPVVLVFLDKRIQEVKNYAVANEMLVVLEGNRRKKYPLADIDLAATMKLNDERGVNFEVPNPVISQ